MSSLSRRAAVLVAVLFAAPACARELRVCADPNNLPFSNERREGFENRIVDVVADELGATVTYTWWAQRRGFLRGTILAGLCDLVPGIPSGFDILRTTRPYYRSTFVFVTRAADSSVTSLDDPRLRSLRIGVQLIGDDQAATPPAQALNRRGMIENIRGFPITGDYAQPSPPARIVEAVAKGDIDVAVAWGPMAGYFAALQDVPLHVTPVSPQIDGPRLPMVWDIGMGVRRDDEALQRAVSGALIRRRAEIAAILRAYRVPRLDEVPVDGGTP